ncbi:MAG: TlpA disulfide reductase family protein [Acidobacteriota bacterium]
MLIKEVVQNYKGKAKFVSENWGNSRLAERYGIKKYPVVFVEEVLVAKPEDFGGWGQPTGKYAPWKESASHEKFKQDVARMIDLTMRDRAKAAKVIQTQTESIAEITALPNLSAQDLQGQHIESASLSGKVVVVEFWATWCAPCRSTLNWLSELKQQHGDKLEVLAIAVESDEAEVRKLAQALNLSARVLMGTEAMAASFGTINSVPTMFVFDRQGKTATIFYGAPEDLHPKAERLLKSILQ